MGLVPSLWFGLRPNYGRGNGSNGDLLQNALCQHAVLPRTAAVSVPDPVAGPCRPTPLPETPGHSQASLVPSLPFSWVLVHTGFVVPSKSLFPQSCGSSVIRSHWTSKLNSLGGFSVPLLDPQIGKSAVRPRTFNARTFIVSIIVLLFVGCLLDSSIVGLMVTSSKRIYATCCASQVCCSQSPCPVAGHC